MDNFFHILLKPDNIPIAFMVPLFAAALLWAYLQSGKSRPESGNDLSKKVHTWPYLVRAEFIAAMVVILVLTIWSIKIDAPLESAANPMITPNPAKAPWYFLGLQELLVYFDPWIAGVIIPGLIVFGLAAIPYLDTNPKGNGSYNIKERPFAVTVFCLGFFILGIGLIVFGVFFRGPGWNFFWPWEYWDHNKVVALTNINLPEALGAKTTFSQFVLGGVFEFCWYLLPVPVWYLYRNRKSFQELGWLRYAIVSFLIMGMMAIPLKMALRHLFNIKYVWVTPWFNY